MIKSLQLYRELAMQATAGRVCSTATGKGLIPATAACIGQSRHLHKKAAAGLNATPRAVYNKKSPIAMKMRDFGCGRECTGCHRRFATTSHHEATGSSIKAAVAEDPIIHDIFEKVTCTWQYVVADPSTSRAVIIDPVLDYDPATQTINTQSADALLDLVQREGYIVDWILETHAHADHLTAASYLQMRLGVVQCDRPSTGIGKRIGQVQKTFGEKYGVPGAEYQCVFDKEFEDDEAFEIGELSASVMHLPGHTPDHLGYKIGDNVFCGDSIFHADIGTARCDFPGGNASSLFRSGRRLLQLPDHVRIWTGHDYPSEDRGDAVAFMTVGQHRELNRHLKDGMTEEEFVALRNARDATLGEPRLLHQSLQINIRGGRLPAPTESEQRLLHLPLKPKGLEW